MGHPYPQAACAGRNNYCFGQSFVKRVHAVNAMSITRNSRYIHFFFFMCFSSLRTLNYRDIRRVARNGTPVIGK